MAKPETEFTKEEIIESINEWPVVDYTSAPTDKIHNPDSVSSFFLRNIGRPKLQQVHSTKSDVETVKEKEVLVDIALAKWWRKNGNEHKSIVAETNSQNPNTIISLIARSDAGVEFMHSEIKRLRSKIAAGSASPSVSSALASFYERLGNLSIAKMHLEGALQKDSDNKEAQWRMLRLMRSIQYRKQQEEALVKLDFNSASELTLPKPKEVRHVSADDLSVTDFFYNHALPGIPVVITGLVCKMTNTPWTLQHIAQVAGDCKVQLKRCVRHSSQWARLEDAAETSVRAFIDTLTGDKFAGGDNMLTGDKLAGDNMLAGDKLAGDNKLDGGDNMLTGGDNKLAGDKLAGDKLAGDNMLVHATTSEKLYLFDWSIPVHCPDLAKDLTIPKYFAGDFLQRTSQGSYYQDSWPSLFIAPGGITSELHVDAFGSNFWMALFQGRKRWTFFNKDDTFKLYPAYEHPWSSDPVFEVDLDHPDKQTFPLLSQAQPIQCVLEPGELLFVPAGSPHRVENLETSVAISANFVDLSNIDLVKDELRMTSLTDQRSHDLLKQLNDPDFKSSMTSKQEHLQWDGFKTWKSQDFSDCDITYESVCEKLAEQNEKK